MALGGQMHHRIRAKCREQGVQGRCINNIGLRKTVARIVHGIFQRISRGRIGHAIHIQHTVPCCAHKMADNSRANKAAAPGK